MTSNDKLCCVVKYNNRKCKNYKWYNDKCYVHTSNDINFMLYCLIFFYIFGLIVFLVYLFVYR